MVGARDILCSLLLLSAAVAPWHAVAGEAERTITVANRSDRTMNEVYVSPSSSDEWGSDRLGDGTIEPKQSRRLALGVPSGRDCVFDVQIVYSDASREERRSVDVCRNRTVAFDASGAVALAGAGSGEHRVLIANDAALPIQQVLISPAEAGDWGEDRLTHDSLSVNDTASVAYRGGCLADLRVVFENRSAEERRGLDVCALGGVSIKPGWTTAAQLMPARPPETAQPPLPLSVTVVNHAGRSVQELYLFPEQSSQNGPDQLHAPLEDGGRAVLDLLRPPGSCRYGARIVFGGKASPQDLSGLDFCREPLLVIPPHG